jgi:NAD(P)-dependent dehydrogenase (short-subunit alcohol dehydrogenase family)
VNVVAPGFVDTEMTAGLPEAVLQGALERIPWAASARPPTSPA